jgi:LPPG:FO 2-phospho-L-lactate transferase
MRRRPIVALAGGIGAARFLDGLTRIVPPGRVFIIGNTGDDAEMHGLHISPDLDTVTYTLAGLSDPVRGWGLRGDTFRCLESLGQLGADTWFRLGDRDLATHLYRTERLRQGATLTDITREIAAALKVRATIVPMSDQRVRTRVRTATGELDFQTYFVQRRARDTVVGLRFEGAAEAQPAPGVIEAIAEAEAIILCPSNPFISIGPILSIPGVREALRARRHNVIGISPIVGGRAIKGPAARMMKSMQLRPSAIEVAKLYLDFMGTFVMDNVDRTCAAEVEALGLRAIVTNTIMTGRQQRKALARVVARSLGKVGTKA